MQAIELGPAKELKRRMCFNWVHQLLMRLDQPGLCGCACHQPLLSNAGLDRCVVSDHVFNTCTMHNINSTGPEHERMHWLKGQGRLIAITRLSSILLTANKKLRMAQQHNNLHGQGHKHTLYTTHTQCTHSLYGAKKEGNATAWQRKDMSIL